MRESFLERFGFRIALGLVILLAWRLISTGLSASEAFSPFFPLRWVALSPAGPFVEGFLVSFKEAPWWLWAEVTITVITWMLLYGIARGVFNAVSSMEGVSMWVAFAICILLAIAFCILLFAPTLRQIDIWRAAWPRPVVPS